MTALFGWASPSYGSEGWIEWWTRSYDFPVPPYHYLRDFVWQASREEERLVVINIREAEEGVGRGLNGFLSYRFAGMKWIGSRLFGGSRGPRLGFAEVKKLPEWFRWIGTRFFGRHPPPPVICPGGGLQFQVSCLTRGLRIHVSPAYFINWVFFGSPTTPVTSCVLPGRYVFAGDGPMLPTLTQDPAVFCIPPSFHAPLTRF